VWRRTTMIDPATQSDASCRSYLVTTPGTDHRHHRGRIDAACLSGRHDEIAQVFHERHYCDARPRAQDGTRRTLRVASVGSPRLSSAR
jgi:hypothetical protein